MRYLVPAGGTAVFLLFVIILLFVDEPAQAQGAQAPVESLFETVFVSGGYYTYPALLMLVAVACTTAAGLVAVSRPDAWPLWPHLARGLGDAAFLFSIVATFAGLREAMIVIAHLGAAVTPTDLAVGLARAVTELGLGAFVAFAGLLGSALLRWRRARALAKMAGDVAGEFA